MSSAQLIKMPEEFSDCRILRWGDIATLEYGKALRTHGEGDGHVRVFGTNGPIGWASEALVARSTVIVGRKGAYRGVHYSAEPCFVIDTAFYVKPKVEFDMRWAYYQLLTQNINDLDSGSAIPSTTRESFYALPVFFPSLEEQRRIAHILGTLDDKIELNRRMCATLEEMARAIFRSWFVDFDPVRAKVAATAEGRDPERAAMAAISGKKEEDLDTLPAETLCCLRATAALFPSSFTDSELGEIPEGWQHKSIYESATVIYGAPFSSTKFNTAGEGKPLVRIRDLKNEAPGVYTPEEHPKGYIIKPGDIVVGMDGEFRAYLWGGEEAWLNQRVCVFKPNLPENRCYVRESIRPQLEAVEASETATTVIHIGKGDFDRFVILDPRKETLRAFSRLVEPMLDKIVQAKQESRTLAALRDTLLPKLLSGELSIGGDFSREESHGNK